MSSAGSTTDRGYGYAHQQERRRWAPIVARGEVTCSRFDLDPECPGLIHPDEAWDLDHTEDRSAWQGPAHTPCNRRAGARKRNRMAAAPPRSRAW